MIEKSNAVFISYRRRYGGMLALALHQHLSQIHGIDAFFDIENIRAGQFDTIILSQIRARPYFIVVLTPGTLEHCIEPDDWLKREIQEALSAKRRIVPVYTPEFNFEDCDRFLPGASGEQLRRYQAVELPLKYFKFAVEQLAKEYLVPIDTKVTPPSAAIQAEVDKLEEAARAAPLVNQKHLAAQQYFEHAYKKYVARDMQGAVADYNKAIETNSEFALAFFNRGLARWKLGDHEGAKADYKEARRLDPSYASAFGVSESAHGGRLSTESEVGNYDATILHYSDYEEPYLNPVAQHDIGWWSMAIKDKAIRTSHTSLAKAFRGRAFVWAKLLDYKNALADFDEAIRLDPDQFESIGNRGVVRQLSGDYKGAIADYDSAIQHDKANENFRVDQIIRRANARGKMGNHKGALADYKEALRLCTVYDFDLNQALQLLGDELARKADYEGAIANYNEVIRCEPNWGTYIYIVRGRARSNLGDHKGAIDDFSEAIQLDHTDANAFIARATVRGLLGDHPGVISDCEAAVRLDPEQKMAFLNRGVAYYMLGDPEQAVRDFDEAIRLDPNYTIAFQSRGDARLAQGNIEGAIGDYDEAIRINPDDDTAFYRRARARELNGDLQGAISDYKQCLLLAPDHSKCDKALSRLGARLDL